MAGVALANDLTLQEFQSGEQAGRAVALVIMSHRAQASLLQRQSGLGPIQCLYLGLLVYTQHQRVFGRWSYPEKSDTL